MKRRSLCVLAVTSVVAGCGSTPLPPDPAARASDQLRFVDLPGFDRDLSASLQSRLPQVSVGFYDRVTPSALPERLQTWMATVQDAGGKVEVVPPPAPLTRSPLLLLSAATTLWSASKVAREMAQRAQFRAAQAYDARILLRHDERGEAVVDRVLFVRRPG